MNHSDESVRRRLPSAGTALRRWTRLVGWLVLSVGLSASLSTARQGEGPSVITGLRLPLLADSPEIDGRLQEWADVPPVSIAERGQVASESAAWPWEGPGDASAEIRLAVDRHNLYIAGTVKDDHIVPDESIWWRGDAIEVFIDTDLEGDRDVDGYNQDDYQIFLMPMSPSRRWGVAVRDGQLVPSDGGFVGVRVRGREIAGGYTFEAALPLANLPGFPRGGGRIGFAVALNDNDWPREGEPDAAYLTLDGAEGLFEHTERFLPAGVPDLGLDERAGGKSSLLTLVMEGAAVLAVLALLVLLAFFARRIHRLVVVHLPGWRRLGLIVVGLITFSLLVAPPLVVGWLERRARLRLDTGVEQFEDLFGRMVATGLFDRWPGLTDPQVLLDLLSGIGVEPRRRYDYTPLEVDGVTTSHRAVLADLPFRTMSMTLAAGRATSFELPSRLTADQLVIAVRTHLAPWWRSAPRAREEIPEALRVTLRALGGGVRSFDFALDDGARRSVGPRHDSAQRRLGVVDDSGHTDLLMVPVEEFFSAGGLIRIILRPLVAGVDVELLGVTGVENGDARPVLLGARTEGGVPTLLGLQPDELARCGKTVTGREAWSAPLEGRFDTLWLVYEVQDPAQILRGLEGQEVARITLRFADGAEDRRVSLQAGRNVRVSGIDAGAESLESVIALRYPDNRSIGFLETLAIDGLGLRELASIDVECVEKRCPLRLAALTGGIEMAPQPLAADAPVVASSDGRRVVLQPELVRQLGPVRDALELDVAVDDIVQVSTLGDERRQRHLGTALDRLDSGDPAALRQFNGRDYWVRDVDLDLGGHRVTLRVHSEIIGRQAVRRAREGVAAVSIIIVLPFLLLYLVDWLRRRQKIRLKLTALFVVTSAAPIILLSLLVLRVVGEERHRVARARAAELARAVQSRVDDLAKAAQDAARSIIDDPGLVTLVDHLVSETPTDERALERELRRMAEGVAGGLPVAARLSIEGVGGQRTLRASPDPALDPAPDFAGRGLVYDWGQVTFRATAERLDRNPRMQLTLGGVVDRASLAGIDLRSGESLGLYSLDRQLGDRHLPGGILLADTSLGQGDLPDSGVADLITDLRTRTGVQFRSTAAGKLLGFTALVDRQGQPVAVVGVSAPASPFRLDVIVAALDVDWLLVLFGALMLTAALFLGGLVTEDITVPIERLEKAARAVSSQGVAPAPVSPAGGDEIGRLTDAYNFMARELERRMSEQERLRALQMEMAGSLALADRVRVAMRFLAREIRPVGLHLLLYEKDRDCLVELSLADGSEKLAIPRNDSLLFDVLGGDQVAVLARSSQDERRARLADELPSLFDSDEAIHLVPLGEAEKGVGVVVARMGPDGDGTGYSTSDHLANLCSLIAASIENARLYQLAIEDPVTGLAVENYLMRRLTAELDRSDATERGIALLLFEITGLETLEKELGSDGTVEMLKQLARNLARACRPMDVLARAGAGGFMVMLPEGGRERVTQIVEQVRRDLPEIHHAGGARTKVRLAHAFAAFPDDGRSREYLTRTLRSRLHASGLRPEVGEPEGAAQERSLDDRFRDLIFNAPASREILEQVARVAATRATVMILGETGVGKDVLARVIHQVSDRRDAPFVAINCSALPETLLESELFGHEKGAFTGADRQKIGRFEMANTGTLFLDEVGEMSPATQVKLLRVLQERRLQRLGGRGEIEVDVRILTATNRNLEEMVRRGTFREDLYYRLKVITITIPPLRERKEEIPDLVELFIAQHNREHRRKITSVEPAALDRLYLHSWPGNVRELRNVIHRAALMSQGNRIEASAIELGRSRSGAVEPPAGTAVSSDEGLALNDRQRKLLALLRDRGSLTNREYYQSVGVSRRTALRDLTDLMDRGLVVRRGRRRGSVYQLARSYLGPSGAPGIG